MAVKPEVDQVVKAIVSLKHYPRPVPLFCGVQQYEWGDSEFIPHLLGIPNPRHEPYAELWIGAHPDLPAQALIDRVQVPLDRLLKELPGILLGSEVRVRYEGQLPFLLKILAAARPLSIQVHPDLCQAKAGFAWEQEQGIPLDSPRRNYRDRNHKPELLCALTPFYVLKGFRPLEEIDAQLAVIPEWGDLLSRFRRDGLEKFYRNLMTLPQVEVDAYLVPVLERLRAQGGFAREEREYWLLRADDLYSHGGHHDRGLFSVFLLNFLCLRPGEAIFQAAGDLHAYLEGVGVEIMANSNNVLRGGLTPKHVDVEALLTVVKFRGEKAQVLTPGRHRPERIYEAPVEEFVLSRLELEWGECFDSTGPLRMGIVLEGKVDLSWKDGQIHLGRGQSYLIPYSGVCRFHARDRAVVYQGACRAKL